MFRIPHKLVIVALTGVVLITLAVVSSRADDLFYRAAAQFREKNYDEAFSLAQKSAESPQRTFLLGVAALRANKAVEAVPLLAESEKRLPLLDDYAALYQAEALLKLRKFTEAAAKAASIPKAYPLSQLIRRSEKLFADIFIEANDFKGALKVYQSFVDKYPSGSDSVDALYQLARSREETGDKGGAAQIYRSLWLNNPAASQAKQAQDRLKDLEKAGVNIAACTPEELLRRASALYAQNQFADSLQTLQSIPLDGQSSAFIARVDLRLGMTQFRLKKYKQAEKYFTKVASSNVAGINAEGRFWLARSLERQGLNESAFALYMELAGEGKKQEFSDDALMEAAGLRKVSGNYVEAARLYEQLVTVFPNSGFISRASWNKAWCRYLASEYLLAAESFKVLLKDDALREKSLYWLSRTLENSGNGDAATYYRMLLEEYPSGFYAAWCREQKKLKDVREGLGLRNVLLELPLLPARFEKPRLLASLGMREEARAEILAARKKLGDKKSMFPGLARLYLEIGEYGSAIALFLQNRPFKWDKPSLPLWTAGYPLTYTEPVVQHASANTLSEALIYALIRTESGFSPTIKSRAGAIGLMQLMPNTAKMVAYETGQFNAQNLTTPEFNIKLGTRHFRDLLKQYNGDMIYALAAYNAGGQAVERWRKNLKGMKNDEFIESIPYQETRDYVKKVYASAATYRQLYGLK
jgi:soluble lytic murein transglycosylase